MSQTQTAPPQQNLPAVIEMFKGLGLPVCDDGTRIKKEFDQRKQRFLRDVNQPDPGVRTRAQKWLRDAETLQNRRGELLRIVYEDIQRTVTVTLMLKHHEGTRKLTRDLIRQLEINIKNSHNLDDELARRFIKKYMEDEDIPPDGELVKREPLSSFDAVSGIGQIELSWTRPHDCRRVEVYRREQKRGTVAGTQSRGRSVYDGGDSHWVDTNVTPGVRYEYRAVPFYGEGEDGPASLRSAPCIGEVSECNAKCIGGAAKLQWKPPTEKVPVVIFKRAEAKPDFRVVHSVLQPADRFTQQVFPDGHATSWEDHEVEPGKTYHYKIVADFGLGLVSKGIDRHVGIPVPPPDVPSVSVKFCQDGEHYSVVLTWKPSTAKGAVRYTVVRKDGSVPADSPTDGKVVHQSESKKEGFTDSNVRPGHRYCYTVFTHIGDNSSRNGTAADPVDILADVVDARTESGNKTIELNWKTPGGADVRICRSRNQPKTLDDGRRLSPSSRGYARDDDLRNDCLYHYLIVCVYRPDGKTERASAGVRCEGVPGLPARVIRFEVEEKGGEVHCRFDQPESGTAVVVRSEQPPPSYSGPVSVDEPARLGDLVPVGGPGSAVDREPDPANPHYSIFTVAGKRAVFGSTKSCRVCRNIRDLEAVSCYDGVELTWTWPERCPSVVVARRVDDWPSGPTDPKASRVNVSRNEYRDAGEKFLDPSRSQHGVFRYVVHARARVAGADAFGTGKPKDCRCKISWFPRPTLRYQIRPNGNKRVMKLAWSLDSCSGDSAYKGFVLRAAQGSVPNSRDDGVELFRWTPDSHASNGDLEATVSLAKVQQQRWTRFYCKAFNVDPEQDLTTLIVHPNTCRDSTRFLSRSSRRKPRRYRRRAPRRVVCPYCFRRFSPGETLFTDYDGADPQRGKWTLWDRVRGRAPRPPVGAHGKPLIRKLCPRHEHSPRDLPFSAGRQESLLIGLIGARSSGKTHYIASLINRLEKDTGEDFSASLMHSTDDTPDRYRREFEKPLFGERKQLQKTIAAQPSPLIYDLTFDGALWGEERNRAVTLTLYDTAGENLSHARSIEQFVQYIRVASGIIFLVDPLQIDTVRQSVPSTVPLPAFDEGNVPNQILGGVIKVMEGGGVLSKGGALDIPMAVVMTKCDVLGDANLLDRNRLWQTGFRHKNQFDRQAHDDMDGMMGEYMRQWSGTAYNTVRSRFSRHAFFGASATGCAHDTKTDQYPFVSPWRVEDPLLWILAELGVIPSTEPD